MNKNWLPRQDKFLTVIAYLSGLSRPKYLTKPTTEETAAHIEELVKSQKKISSKCNPKRKGDDKAKPEDNNEFEQRDININYEDITNNMSHFSLPR